jgi:hypothetical protein
MTRRVYDLASVAATFPRWGRVAAWFGADAALLEARSADIGAGNAAHTQQKRKPSGFS